MIAHVIAYFIALFYIVANVCDGGEGFAHMFLFFCDIFSSSPGRSNVVMAIRRP